MRIVTLLIAALAVGCGTTSSQLQKERKSDALLQIGTSNLIRGNYPVALKALMEAEALAPENPIIQNNLGLAYYVRNRYKEAEKHISRALELNPKYTDARNNLGRLYVDLGNFKKALIHLKIAEEDLTYTQPERIWANLGYAYFHQGDYITAKDYLFKAVRARREDCESLNYYGRSLLELREFKVAAETLDQAIRLCAKQKYEEPHFYSALAYLKLGQVDEAEARFEEIVKLYPFGDYAKKSRKMLETIR